MNGAPDPRDERIAGSARAPAGPRLVRSQTDLVAGLFLLACALLLWWFGQPLKAGTAFRMGPGYVPMMLAWILAAFGVVLTAMGLLHRGPRLERWRLGPIVMILGAIVVFGLTIERAGLLIASALVVAMGGIATPDSRLREVLLLALCLAAFACLLFPIALQLPLNILP